MREVKCGLDTLEEWKSTLGIAVGESPDFGFLA